MIQSEGYEWASRWIAMVHGFLQGVSEFCHG